ncbi:MAG: hypothetical protein FJX18_02045 [Alphaproteobacteria bacterium]|nr:hypothetical protein [Alphaproteobacteria bacterium]
MNKKIAFGLMVAGLGYASTGHANNWYVGAGLGYTKANASTKVDAVDATPDFGRDKKSFTSSSILGTIFVGHTFHCNEFSWFVQGRGLWDNAELKSDVNLAAPFNKDSVKINRTGTLGFDVGATKSFYDIDFSLKLGVLLSKFDVKYDDLQGVLKERKSSYGWGFAPGLSVEKNLGFMTMGLNYEYQIYAPLKQEFSEINTSSRFSVRSKPRYHSVMITVKKAL